MSHYFLYYSLYCEYSGKGLHSCDVCSWNILQNRQHLTLSPTVEALFALIDASIVAKKRRWGRPIDEAFVGQNTNVAEPHIIFKRLRLQIKILMQLRLLPII
jgi:hypothetical protein